MVIPTGISPEVCYLAVEIAAQHQPLFRVTADDGSVDIQIPGTDHDIGRFDLALGLSIQYLGNGFIVKIRKRFIKLF